MPDVTAAVVADDCRQLAARIRAGEGPTALRGIVEDMLRRLDRFDPSWGGMIKPSGPVPDAALNAIEAGLAQSHGRADVVSWICHLEPPEAADLAELDRRRRVRNVAKIYGNWLGGGGIDSEKDAGVLEAAAEFLCPPRPATGLEAPAALTRVQAGVLRVLAKSRGRALVVAEIVEACKAEGADGPGRDKGSIQAALLELEKLGLVCRPSGRKGGRAITERGLAHPSAGLCAGDRHPS